MLIPDVPILLKRWLKTEEYQVYQLDNKSTIEKNIPNKIIKKSS